MADRSLTGYAALTGLGHSAERLEALDEQIAGVLSSLTQLDRVEVTGAEPAVVYPRPAERDEPA